MADEERRAPGFSEEDPLLGSPGDASQQEGKPLYYNFFIGMASNDFKCISLTVMLGTGTVAQAGAWIVRLAILQEITTRD
jgi:hypothetical protein